MVRAGVERVSLCLLTRETESTPVGCGHSAVPSVSPPGQGLGHAVHMPGLFFMPPRWDLNLCKGAMWALTPSAHHLATVPQAGPSTTVRVIGAMEIEESTAGQGLEAEVTSWS